jgi:hypothetical protein
VLLTSLHIFIVGITVGLELWSDKGSSAVRVALRRRQVLMSEDSLSEKERQQLREGRISRHGHSLVRVQQAELISGERVSVCAPGQHPVWNGVAYNVLEPAHLWSVGWFLDEPWKRSTHRPHMAQVLRDDIIDDQPAGGAYAVPQHATRGVLVLFVYAVRGQLRMVKDDEMDRVVADVLHQMAVDPSNIDAVGVIQLPLGFSLATLDPTRIEFWRKEPDLLLSSD